MSDRKTELLAKFDEFSNLPNVEIESEDINEEALNVGEQWQRWALYVLHHVNPPPRDYAVRNTYKGLVSLVNLDDLEDALNRAERARRMVELASSRLNDVKAEYLGRFFREKNTMTRAGVCVDVKVKCNDEFVFGVTKIKPHTISYLYRYSMNEHSINEALERKDSLILVVDSPLTMSNCLSPSRCFRHRLTHSVEITKEEVLSWLVQRFVAITEDPVEDKGS